MKIIIELISLSLLIYIFLTIQNKWIQLSFRSISFKKLPNSFNGFKIVHLSDLHDSQFGKGHEKIIKKINKVSPDIIVFSGDFVDRTRYNLSRSMKLIDGLVSNYSIYYVTGNHEESSGHINEILEKLRDSGVTVLRNQEVNIFRNSEKIKIIGIEDPSFKSGLLEVNNTEFSIMISHRSEMVKYYEKSKVDIIFTGHSHGGQFRIFNRGILSPHQGLFPKYTSGIHNLGETKLVISRGLGNSVFPFRLFNRPEIVIIELKKEGNYE